MSYFLDPEEIDPIDTAHHELHRALEQCDAKQVRGILAREPKAAQPRGGWMHGPLDTLLRVRWKRPQGWNECLVAMLEAGADPNIGVNSNKSLVARSIQDGDVEALDIIAQSGRLDLERDWLTDVCTSTLVSGREMRNLPLLAISRILLDAGVPVNGMGRKTHERIDGWAWSLLSLSPVRPHPELFDTLDLFCQQGAIVSETAVMRGLAGGNEKAIAFLVQRCETSGVELIKKIEAMDNLKPEKKAMFTRIALEAGSQEAEEVSVRRGIRL